MGCHPLSVSAVSQSVISPHTGPQTWQAAHRIIWADTALSTCSPSKEWYVSLGLPSCVIHFWIGELPSLYAEETIKLSSAWEQNESNSK